jgi:hypothetical protein
VNKTALLALVFLLVFLAILIYSTMGLRRHRVKVCMTFNGRTSCRTAGASTREQALRAATDNACAFIATGMTESMACTGTPPASVKWLDER